MFVTPTFATIDGTGTITIPVGVRAFHINVVSGQSTTINGIPVQVGTIWPYTAADAKCILDTAITVFASGVSQRTTVFYAV